MLEAAPEDQLDVDRLSFTGRLHILQARWPECDSSTPTRLEEWYRLLPHTMYVAIGVPALDLLSAAR